MKEKKKKEVKYERHSMRCTKPQKRMMEKVAKGKGVSLTRCTIQLYEDAEKKQKNDENIAALVCDLQTLVNHIKNHHTADEYTQEECDKIWEKLNL